MCGIDFSRNDEYTAVSSHWALPQKATANGKFVPAAGSIYNAKILQPLCNIRNNFMARAESSPFAKRAVSYLCAAAMVISAFILGTAEAVTRLALGIITSPMMLGMLCSDNGIYMIPLVGLLGGPLTFVSMGSAFRAAGECFTKSSNIEGFRTKLFA